MKGSIVSVNFERDQGKRVRNDESALKVKNAGIVSSLN
jgi:hypothetical protein